MEDEKEHEYIFRTLKDEKYRDLLQEIVEPLVETVLTSKLSGIENNIKRDVSHKLDNTVKSLVETNLTDLGVTWKRKKAPVENVEDGRSSNQDVARKKSKHCEKYEPDKCESRYTSADEAIADWRKMANNEWENARRTDLTELKGLVTVICLDTSASMNENNAWEHSKHFIKNYLDIVAELHANENTRAEMVALVTFGKETKVQKRLTKDYDGLISEFEKIKPEGPSPMFGGLVLSKAVAKTSDCIAKVNNEMTILPKIIIITDGKPTDIHVIHGPERTELDDVKQTLKIIEEEAKTFTKKEIELHIVYVGNPDYDFLHSLRDCTGGAMLTYKEAGKIALNVLVETYLRQISLKREISKRKETEGSQGSQESKCSELSELLELRKSFQKIHEKLLEKIDELPSVTELMEILENMRKNTKNKYYVEEDKKGRYPRIGSRVRRSKDWKWGDQDGNGPGTIIGHCYKENSEDRQIHVWVEWDEDERQNIYRYKTYRSTKADVKIIEEERVPPDDEILAVGMKVGIGPDYSGEQKPRQGVVIRMFDDDDTSQNDNDEPLDITRAEVLWEDDERGTYLFGDKGSKVEIQPRIQYSKPEKPRNIIVTDVSDKEVCLKWDRPASCGGCNIKKYSIYKKSDKLGSKWLLAVEIESGETKATVASLEQNQMYLFAVVAENRIGCGDMAETNEYTKLNTSICKPEPPAGPLKIKHVTKSSCTVYWKESPVCEKKPVKHYLIEIREAGKSSWTKVNTEGNSWYKLTTLRKSTTYELQVKSVNDSGVSEPLGTESFVTKTFLDSDIPVVILQDKHLAQMASALAGDWQLLGHYLGLNNVEIDHIVMQNKSSGAPMLIYKMLSVWRQRNPDTATFYRLIEAIEDVNAVTVDWDKISDVARKINESA